MKIGFLSDKNFTSKLLGLAMPITIQHLMVASVAVADALMLGSVEQNQMSAVSQATQIQFIQNIVMFAIIAAASVLGAQYWGRGDKRSVNQIFCIALRICTVVSIVTFVGCVFFPRALMYIFTDVEELVDIGAGYLELAGWSYLLTGISQCYLTLMKITENPTATAKISAATVVINIALNAVFIYGLLGAPAMGMRGAALATLIARIVEMLLAVGLTFGKKYFTPSLKYLFRFNKILSKDFSRCAWPLIGASIFWGVGFTSYTAFMGHLGKDAAAANSITAVVRDMVCCACDGISNGGGIMVGNELGTGNLEKGKKYGDWLVKIAFALGIISTIIMLALTPIVVSLVKLSTEARGLLVGMMLIMGVYMIGRVVNTIIINGIFASGGDTMFDMYSLAVTMWGIAVPLAAAGTFLFDWPVWVVYACTCLDEVGKIPWVIIHYKKYKWVKDLTRSFDSPLGDGS